jgi:hypothetical protein
MPVGSLIFVVVLFIWATYLSLYVARRREQVSTARSVDRFSAHMRVLQRRMVKSAAEPEETPSSGNTRSSILAAGALDEAGRLEDVYRSEAAPVSAVERRVQVARDFLGSVHSNRVFAAWGGFTGVLDRLNPRRLRAYALLTFALAGLVSFLLAATGRIGWLLPALCAAGVFGLLAWLRVDRMTVVAARERRATAERSDTERAAAQARRLAEAEAAELARRAAEARPEAGPLPVAQEHAPQPSASRQASYEFFDLAALERSEAGAPAAGSRSRSRVEAAVHAEAAERGARTPAESADPIAADGSWSPVPVPPPTYTLKARAEHPLPPALATPPAPVPIEVDDEYEAALWRRDAVG